MKRDDPLNTLGLPYATTVIRLTPPGCFSTRIWVRISSANRLTWEITPTILPLARNPLRAATTRQPDPFLGKRSQIVSAAEYFQMLIGFVEEPLQHKTLQLPLELGRIL